ncbi:MAG: hypothetical protein E7310_06145 [Clostridiales bacterium]|nr:hypothetical protein [Clostridiales bacterium]
MENMEYSNSLYQISEILKYIEPNLKARIPNKFISYFEANKSKDYKWNIDRSLPIDEQDLLPITKEILTVLYKDYICNDIERIELEKILNENEVKYQKELREKYNPDNIFGNKSKVVEKTIVANETTSALAYKKSFIKRIISKIKLFFNR